jgi:hypothetical protein
MPGWASRGDAFDVVDDADGAGVGLGDAGSEDVHSGRSHALPLPPYRRWVAMAGQPYPRSDATRSGDQYRPSISL